MKPKKVLIIYGGARVWGGIETYLENLFKYYDHKKLELILVSLGEWELTKKLLASEARCIILNKSRIRLKTVNEIATVIENEKINLIVSQGVVANAYARLAARKTKKPHLATVHSNINYDYPDQAKRILYKISDKKLRSVTKKYIAVSKYIKSELIKSGIPNEKITVIYNGVDSELFCLEANHQQPKANDLVTVGSIGRFHHTKGYHNLIKAFVYLKEIPISLVIYGDGEEKKPLEELIKKLGLSEKVTLAGHTQNIAQTLDNIDIYVQSSLMEGFGLTVVEAMLANKPIIVTPVGSLPELISDGKTGLIASDTKPESIAVAIKALVENKDLAQKLAKAGKINAEKKFSINKWVSETEKVYLENAR